MAYAIGHGPAQSWHADGAILDWDHAPPDLRAAYDRGAIFAAWNATFDAAIWNFSTLGFPFLPPERVIDVMVQAGVSNLPTDLESASRYPRRRGQAEGRQGADQAVLRRRRRARRASRGMAALSLLRAPGRRGDARGLSPRRGRCRARSGNSTGRSSTSIGAAWPSTCHSFAALPPWRPRTASPAAAGWPS